MDHPDKLSTDLHRLLNAQDFKSKEKLEAFMKNLVGQKIPEFEKEALSFEEQAEDMVMEAAEMEDEHEALMHVMHALDLDPDCIRAYEFLATRQPLPQLALPMYAYAIELGRKKFKKELKEEWGHFWGIFETRPFMRCLAGYASCLHAMALLNRALDVYKEALELNENDNMGLRHQYGVYLLEALRPDEFKALDEKFEREKSSMATFNRLLYYILIKGESPETIEILKEAKKQNKFIAGLLTAKKEPELIPPAYSPGHRDEALYYASFAYEAWHNVEGAVDFLKKHRK